MESLRLVKSTYPSQSYPLIPHTKQPNRVLSPLFQPGISNIVHPRQKTWQRGCAAAKNRLAALHNPPIHGCVVADALSTVRTEPWNILISLATTVP